MSFQIPCPYCGLRDHTEFTYGGDATVERPDPNTATDAQWADYIYTRDNPRGAHREWWQHNAGCRQWLVVQRDTRTHVVTGAEVPGDEK